MPLSQKCQNNVLCGNMNMDVSPYILKFKFFIKNTCSIKTAWFHVGLLESKSGMIYLPKNICLIIIHRNTRHSLDMSCCHKASAIKEIIMKILKYVCSYTICMLIYFSL